MKNPLGLNQAELVAGLVLELVKSSKKSYESYHKVTVSSSIW